MAKASEKKPEVERDTRYKVLKPIFIYDTYFEPSGDDDHPATFMGEAGLKSKSDSFEVYEAPAKKEKPKPADK